MSLGEYVKLDKKQAKIFKKACENAKEDLKEEEYNSTCIIELLNIIEDLNDKIDYLKDSIESKDNEIVELIGNGGRYETYDD